MMNAKNESEEGWWQFLTLITKIKDSKELNELFNLFFTLEEKEDLKARCKIIEELVKGKLTQREIAAKYSISISKITRGSNAIKIISNDLRDFLNNHL